MKRIARIRTDFPEKFGIPRQSGLVKALTGKIVFDPEYTNAEALSGLEDFSHLWLIWEFSEMKTDGWSPTVRPPRLGGNKRVGVFATRSPNRPNPIGLSSVKLEKIENTKDGTILVVSGADMVDGTPIYDIKPYLPYVDCHPDATDGFAAEVKDYSLKVDFHDDLQERIPADKRRILTEVLAGDPRPSYQNDSERVYGMKFSGMEVKFRVENGVLYVCDITKEEQL